jgi:hypothetical protein
MSLFPRGDRVDGSAVLEAKGVVGYTSEELMERETVHALSHFAGLNT